MNRLARFALPSLARAVAFRPLARASTPLLTAPSRLATTGPAGHSDLDPTLANYPMPADLDPSAKNDYEKYVSFWRAHFQNLQDDFELERGLNHIFSTDWVPSVEVIADALRAAREQNTFATAVRTLEALKGKTSSEQQYQSYIKDLTPLLEELGIVDKEGLGHFEFVREKRWWME
ncbi:cytochrome c oxidase, subunit VA/VI [Fimicolochytrium jonesii]|uniref:cytochrome c oxidase, subunit VA/VI n=1 Tax=Fimicolochytrium jonesii TaxID=1396493 RepID=UPI0022FDD340|nr:cytochrome c oxidase, subunit VA/VI [Fimicolochytrium jonesii]KAI8819029.1 cytochrome c oxidase, subunit VA/VI [Fimicolochytrium jonesii]